MFDMPPPSTTTSGSSTLISAARARPRRSRYRASVATAPGSPPAAARTISRLDNARPVRSAWSRSNAAREPGFDAAALAAVTGRTGPLVGPEPGKWIMPPFAGDEVRARQAPAIHDDPASDSRAEDDAEHDVRARGRAGGGLGEPGAVRDDPEPHPAVPPIPEL